MADDTTSFLGPATSPEADALAAGDLAGLGYVMNVNRLWGHQAKVHDDLFAVVQQAIDTAGLTLRDRGVLITSMASTIGDSYCSLAWGGKLAGEADAEVAAAVLRGDDAGLDERERALAAWSRKVSADANGTNPADLDDLRAAGYDDAQILAITAFVALRAAFSTINDALGAKPDAELVARLPSPVLDAVTYGRSAATP
jgi:alkylhydroperoxidase family enzyme